MDETTYQLNRAVAAWIQTGGVFVAVTVLHVSVVRSRLQSRLRVYEAGHEGWMQFRNIAVEHPDLQLLVPNLKRLQERFHQDREVERSGYLTLLAVLPREYFLSRKTGQGRKSSALLVQFGSTYVTDARFMDAIAVNKFLYRQDFIQRIEHVACGVPDSKRVTDRSVGFTTSA